MSTEVFVGHMNPGYDKKLEVTYTTDEGIVTKSYIIDSGECLRFMVYHNQNMKIREIDG